MEENNQRPRRPNSTRASRSYHRRNPQKEQPNFMDMVALQASVCVIILLGVICIRYINTDATNNLQEKLKIAISNEITAEDLKSSLKTGEESIETFKQSVQTIFGRNSEDSEDLDNAENNEGILENIQPQTDAEINESEQQETTTDLEQQPTEPEQQTTNTDQQTTQQQEPETQQTTETQTEQPTEQQTEAQTEQVEAISNEASVDTDVLQKINSDVESIEKNY